MADMEQYTVKAEVIKVVYSDPLKGYRVLGCIVKQDDTNHHIPRNRYGGISVSGYDLDAYDVGSEYGFVVRADQRSKYEGSYVVVGLPGVNDTGERITVDRDEEYNILAQYMSSGQARNVNAAYPDFVERVLNNEESTIDYHNIYNVGQVYIEKYIGLIKEHCRSILFSAVCRQYGIEKQNDIVTLTEIYATTDELKEALTKNPYKVYIGLIGWKFAKADKLVLNKFPDMIDGPERCEYAIDSILTDNESEGHTRINANLMAQLFRNIAPECVQHLHEVALSSEMFHYDPDTKNIAKRTTYEAERVIAMEVAKRVVEDKTDPKPPLSWEEYTTVDGFECTDEQKEGLRLAATSRVMILNGPGGTGKTQTLRAIVRMLEANGKGYMLMAPTGKAAGRVRESTGRSAHTIHMALSRYRGDLISAEYIVLDEFSMVGVHLLANLIYQAPAFANFIFVCDENQLASISCGNVIQDMIESHIVPIVHLTKVFRYGIGGIATLATDIRNGETGGAEDYEAYPDLFLHPASGKDCISTAMDVYDELLGKGSKKEDIMILCPFNKGPVGCNVLNNQCQTRFNPHRLSKVGFKLNSTQEVWFAVGDKVINTHNNYKMPMLEIDEEGNLVRTMSVERDYKVPDTVSAMVGYDPNDPANYTERKTTIGQQFGVMNGDIGYVLKIDDGEDVKRYSMAVQFDNGIAYMESQEFCDLLLGYAISIHKSQGSQSPAVILVVDKAHEKMLTRNILYVGVSRASKELHIVGDFALVQAALKFQENKERDTWLKDLLVKMYTDCCNEKNLTRGSKGDNIGDEEGKGEE